MKVSEVLSNSEEATRKMIVDFITKRNMTLNMFCKEACVHQSNVHVFLNGNGKSLSVKTTEKIARYIQSMGE